MKNKTNKNKNINVMSPQWKRGHMATRDLQENEQTARTCRASVPPLAAGDVPQLISSG